MLAYQAGYRDANRDRIRQQGAVYAASHREARREKSRAYYLANRERFYDSNRDWRRRNPARFAVQAKVQYNRRRARMFGPGSAMVSDRDWRRLVTRFHGRCAYCDRSSSSLQMDHVIPLSRGGRHSIGNILPACGACNRSKGRRFIVEWRRADSNGGAVRLRVHREPVSSQ